MTNTQSQEPEGLLPITQVDLDCWKAIFGFTDYTIDPEGDDARGLQLLARHRLSATPTVGEAWNAFNAESTTDTVARLKDMLGLDTDFDNYTFSIKRGNLRKILSLSALTPQPNTEGWQYVPKEPTEAQWGGLARVIMMWLDMSPKTPRSLFDHLHRTGEEVPDWLRNDPEMQRLDHVPSKGTRCVLIYRAMLDAAPATLEAGA